MTATAAVTVEQILTDALTPVAIRHRPPVVRRLLAALDRAGYIIIRRPADPEAPNPAAPLHGLLALICWLSGARW